MAKGKGLFMTIKKVIGNMEIGIISVLIMMLIGGCSSQDADITIEETESRIESLEFQEDDLKEIEYNGLHMQIPIGWTITKDLDSGVIGVNTEGATLSIVCQNVEKKCNSEELFSIVDSISFIEKVDNKREEQRSGMDLSCCDIVGKVNDINVHGSMYAFSTDSNAYFVIYAIDDTYNCDEDFKRVIDKMTFVEKTVTEDFVKETNRIIMWNEFEMEIPNSWKSAVDNETGCLYLAPDQEKPPVFLFGTISTDEKYDLSDISIQQALAEAMVQEYSTDITDCELLGYNVPMEYFQLSNGEKLDITGRHYLNIECVGKINEVPCQGKIMLTYIGDNLYGFNLFQYNNSQYDFSEDMKSIIATIRNTTDIREGEIEENALQSENSELAGQDEGAEDSKSGYGDSLRYIPGCDAYAIMENMGDKFEIEKPRPMESQGTKGYIFTALSGSFQYEIYTYSSLSDVYMVDFAITNTGYSINDFEKEAQKYMMYAASIPYDTSDAERAQEWVKENIANISQGNTFETVIGDAKFSLYGDWDIGAVYLDISLEPFPF